MATTKSKGGARTKAAAKAKAKGKSHKASNGGPGAELELKLFGVDLAGAAKAAEKRWAEPVGKLLMASLDAVHSSRGAVNKFVHGLVDKGALSRKDAGRVLEAWVAKGKEKVSGGREKVRETARKATGELGQVKREIDQRIEGVLNRFQFPSRKDFDRLNRKLDELGRKVDTLSKGAGAKPAKRSSRRKPAQA